jgi:predicted transposase YbfD/YdcC
MTHRKNKNDFEKCLNIQLHRLQTDYIDYYLIHMLTDLDMWNKLKDAGIVSWIMEKKKTLEEVLEGVEDFRQKNSVDHKLTDILLIAIVATICGATGYVHIYKYAEAKISWLKTFLELPNGIPSAYTMRRVMMHINPKQFHAAFIEWVEVLCQKVSGLVAIDGKTVRRTKGMKDGKKALHVVSAFAMKNKLVLGQIATDEKSNEITAIPELLKMLSLQGCIVSIDAMGTQKEIAEQIKDSGADYVLSLKENQKILHNDIKLYMETEILTQSKETLKEKEAYHTTVDNEHGRLEKREYYACNDVEWLPQKGDWKGLTGFGVCVSTVTIQRRKADDTTGEKIYKLVEETTVSRNYAIYSVENMTAKQFAEYKRGHWGIENSLHWSLDMAFREDESRARADHSAENLNIIRHLSHNLLKGEASAKASLATKRLMCGWDDAYLLKVLSNTGI